MVPRLEMDAYLEIKSVAWMMCKHKFTNTKYKRHTFTMTAPIPIDVSSLENTMSHQKSPKANEIPDFQTNIRLEPFTDLPVNEQ